MLAHVLALAVAIGSIAIYLAAFFFPEVHRKNDFIWSGVGLFYGLVLWVFARRITGGLLLGHVASVALLVWFGWQTMSLRRQIVLQAQQTPIPTSAKVQANIREQVTKISIGERIGELTSSLGEMFAGMKNKSATQTNAADSTILNKAIIDVIATADNESTSSQEEVTATETGEHATATETVEQATANETETEEQATDVATTDVEATEIEAKTENETELTPSTPPSPESEPVEASEIHSQTPPATTEVSPPAEESDTDKKPPDTSSNPPH